MNHNINRCIPPLKTRTGHIIYGENIDGRVGGFHSIIGQCSSRKIISQGPKNIHDVYNAKVAIKNLVSDRFKTESSTMYPDTWDESKILHGEMYPGGLLNRNGDSVKSLFYVQK